MRRGEIRKQDEERRQHSEMKRDDEKRRKRSEDEKSSTGTCIGGGRMVRNLMGTLIFMNSLYDTPPMMSERISSKNYDDSSLLLKKQSRRSDTRCRSSGKRSGFRIIR
jgi:hypothetical protein